MSECETCGGLGFIQGEKREPCLCIAKRKARVYLRKLRPFSPLPDLTPALDEADTDRHLLIQVPTNFQPLQMKWVFAYLLLKKGMKRTYELLNAYEAVLAKFGEHESYPTLLKINREVLCFYYGFNEMKNTMLGEIVVSLLDIREVKGLRNWLLIRGGPPYASLITHHAQEREYQILDLSGSSIPSTSDGLRGSLFK